MSIDSKTVKRQPLIVEIVGPAGAGKTTLLQALNQKNEKFRLGFCLRRIEYLPLLVSNTFRLLPIFFRQFRNGRSFSWREVKAMLYLEVLHRVLARRQVSDKSSAIILVQGPVYKLTKLYKSGPQGFKSQPFERWCGSITKRWASTLHELIWLDAPDGILLERIHARNKRHSVKEKSEKEVCKFLGCYRTSFEQVISKLTANSGPKLLRFDTGQESLDQIAAKVLAAFD